MITERNHFFESSVWLDTDCKEYPLQGVGLEGGMEGLQHLGWGWLCVWFPCCSPVLFPGVLAVVLAVVLPGFPCSGGWLRSLCLSRMQGVGLWLLTLAIAYFYGETLYTHTYTRRCLDSGVNRYTDVLY
ncbi:hypothetical protein ILYODFUR_034398 [Ilyodon furcidens]|uniref:Uncharacterized protein n=1 Tax=Ilyodon furcidens TaxID=33524 RepID=A0ABV0TQX3_9TELE